MKVGIGLLGRLFMKFPCLPTRGCLQKGGSGGKGRGGRRREGRGGKDRGGASGRGGLAEVQGRDYCWHWTAQVVIGVDHVFPLHPCAPVLQGMWDGGTNRGQG